MIYKKRYAENLTCTTNFTCTKYVHLTSTKLQHVSAHHRWYWWWHLPWAETCCRFADVRWTYFAHVIFLSPHGATQPIVVVFSQPGSGLWPPRVRGYWITHSDASQSVGLLWTNDQCVAETSTWQHTTLTIDKLPWPGWDSNPRSQQTSGRRPTP